MLNFIRSVFLGAAGVGGAWGVFNLLQQQIVKVNQGEPFKWEGPAILLLIPVLAIGWFAGVFLAGLIFPAPRR